MGEDFDSRDLIVALNAAPIIVCPNRLGTINQVLLVLVALLKKFHAGPRELVSRTPIPPVARTRHCSRKRSAQRICEMPWLDRRKK
jgi:hypothetical protein